MLPNFNLRCLEDELTVIVDVKNVQDQLVHVVLPLYHVPLFVNAKAMNVKIPSTLRRTFGSRNINTYTCDLHHEYDIKKGLTKCVTFPHAIITLTLDVTSRQVVILKWFEVMYVDRGRILQFGTYPLR